MLPRRRAWRVLLLTVAAAAVAVAAQAEPPAEVLATTAPQTPRPVVIGMRPFDSEGPENNEPEMQSDGEAEPSGSPMETPSPVTIAPNASPEPTPAPSPPPPPPPATPSTAGSSTGEPPTSDTNGETNSPTPTPEPTTHAPRDYVRPPGESAANDAESGIVGGKTDTNNASTNAEKSARASPLYDSLQYAVGVVAAVSMLLLLVSHSMAVDARFDWTAMACAPNTWEFVLYASYVQHLLSMAQLVAAKTPYALRNVLDGLSWSSFVPYHGDERAIAIAIAKSNPATRRRLTTVVLQGIVAFADRIGVHEAELLVRTLTGLAIFAGGFLVLFFGVAAVTKKKIDHHDNHPSLRNPLDVSRILFWRGLSMRVIGVLILLWVLSLYPLSAMATYEVSMEIRAKHILPAQLVLAILAVFIVCLGGLLLVALTLRNRTERELRQPFHLAAWGCLYADYVHHKRLFLLAPVTLQIASGAIVGIVTWDVLQLTLLVAIHALYLLAVLVWRPFVQGSVAVWFTLVIGVVKLLNLGIAFAFVETSTWSSKSMASTADVIVWLNAMLLFFWLLRHSGMIYQIVWCLRVGAARKHREETYTNFTAPTSVFFVEQDAASMRSLCFSESWALGSKERISIDNSRPWKAFDQQYLQQQHQHQHNQHSDSYLHQQRRMNAL